MDAYADYVSETIRNGNPLLMARQKAIEERIDRPFRIPEATPAGRHARK